MLMPLAQDPDGDATFSQIPGYSLALIPVGLLPSLLGMTGSIYLWAAVMGLAFLYFVPGVAGEIEESCQDALACGGG